MVPEVHSDSEEETADADLSLMNRTKRQAREKAAKASRAHAAELRRQLTELEDLEESPLDSDQDHDPDLDQGAVQEPPSSKDMGAFIAAAVSFLCINYEPLEAVDSFDVLFDLNDSVSKESVSWITASICRPFILLISDILRPRSTC